MIYATTSSAKIQWLALLTTRAYLDPPNLDAGVPTGTFECGINHFRPGENNHGEGTSKES